MEPVAEEFFGRGQQLPGVSTAEAFLARNQQTEVRYLLDLTARYPRCVFVAKTARADNAASDPRTGYRWLAFGTLAHHLGEKEDSSGGADQLSRIVAELAPDVSVRSVLPEYGLRSRRFRRLQMRRRTAGSRSRSGSSKIYPIARSTSTALTAQRSVSAFTPSFVRDRERPGRPEIASRSSPTRNDRGR